MPLADDNPAPSRTRQVTALVIVNAAVLREVGLNALDVPVNDGVEMAFDGELPEACRFRTLERLNSYYFWQLQLARLRRSGFYETGDKAALFPG